MTFGEWVDVGLLLATSSLWVSLLRMRRAIEAERRERVTLRDRVRNLEAMEEL